MKTTIFKLSAFALLFALTGAGCKTDKDSLLTYDVGEIVSVFELKYGDTKKIVWGEETVELSIKEIKDFVSIDCSLADFGNYKEASNAIRIYSYLNVNTDKLALEVVSKPCGAIMYKNDGTDVQEIENTIVELKSAPANSTQLTYFSQAFVNLFGNGTDIPKTSFRIFMAKAFPTNYDSPKATANDYKFIFIITRKN